MTEQQNAVQSEQQPEHVKGKKQGYENANSFISRRQRRSSYRTKYRNNRTPVGSGFLDMGIAWNPSAIFFPKRNKLKGWQKTRK